MTSNGKQFTVNREMLTAVTRDQRWPDVVAGISARFSKFPLVLFCYITNNLMTDPLGNSELFDVIVFAMLSAHGIWRETVSLLDVM